MSLKLLILFSSIVLKMAVSKVSAINDNFITVCRNYESEANDVNAKSLKWYVSFIVNFPKITEGVKVTKTPTFHGNTRVLLKSDDFDIQFNEVVNKIHESVAKYIQEECAWTLNQVDKIDLCTVKYKPLYGGSYVPKPKEISIFSQGIVNIRNKDNRCFLW